MTLRFTDQKTKIQEALKTGNPEGRKFLKHKA
jgi:hypothetical protein